APRDHASGEDLEALADVSRDDVRDFVGDPPHEVRMKLREILAPKERLGEGCSDEGSVVALLVGHRVLAPDGLEQLDDPWLVLVAKRQVRIGNTSISAPIEHQ